MTAAVALPLVVDLDGTLIHTDMLMETGLHAVKRSPHCVPMMPFELLKGKASFKRWLWQQSGVIQCDQLPYDETLLAWLKTQKAAGRQLVLCSGSTQALVELIASEVGIFDEVLGSSDQCNLTGAQKARVLVDRFGSAGFDYVGNAEPDMQVWAHARQVIAVNTSKSLERTIRQHWPHATVFDASRESWSEWRKALRIHQWMKNLLIFAPVLAAHQFEGMHIWAALLLAFLAFSLCASAIYILNDLFDLESDRRHPRKRFRPFASGSLPIGQGLLVSAVLLLLSMLLAQQIEGQFSSYLMLYFMITSVYSWTLKRLMLIDCLTLSGLYTLRILAGASAAGLSPSFWLLAFSVSLFLSLAFIKRYVELSTMPTGQRTEKAHGRGYFASDAPLIQVFGVTSGYAAVIVLALYFNSEAVQKLYVDTSYMAVAIPVVLFWVSWMWMQAHRGNVDDDPIVFAIKDKVSLLAGVAFAAVLVLGATGLLS